MIDPAGGKAMIIIAVWHGGAFASLPVQTAAAGRAEYPTFENVRRVGFRRARLAAPRRFFQHPLYRVEQRAGDDSLMGAAHDGPLVGRSGDLLVIDGLAVALHHVAGVDLVVQQRCDGAGLPFAAAKHRVGNKSLLPLVMARRLVSCLIQPDGNGVQPCAFRRPFKYLSDHWRGYGVDHKLVAIVRRF